MQLQYRAEIYHPHSGTLVKDLAVWDTQERARKICEEHAQQRELTWRPVWGGLWESNTGAWLYRIVMIRP